MQVSLGDYLEKYQVGLIDEFLQANKQEFILFVESRYNSYITSDEVAE